MLRLHSLAGKWFFGRVGLVFPLKSRQSELLQLSAPPFEVRSVPLTLSLFLRQITDQLI